MYAVMEGVATPEAVDEVFKLGMAHPMGPLTLASTDLGAMPVTQVISKQLLPM